MWRIPVEYNKPAAICLGSFFCWSVSLVCRGALVILFLAVVLWPIPAHAESVPPHIVSMTKELLLATRDNFTAASGKDEQAQRVQRIYRILKREGLYNWSLTPVTRDGFVPKMAAVFGLNQIGTAETVKFIKFLEAQTGGRSDAAIDDLYTALGRAHATGAERKSVVDGWNTLWAETWAGIALTYEIEASRGPQTISLACDMGRSRFTIRVLDEDDVTTKKMQTTITGIVRFAFDQNARDLIVSVRPAKMPITSGSPDIQSATAQPGLGPTDKKIDPEERSDKQEQIDAKRRWIEEIKSDKAHIWENTETGEKVRQKRFRRLNEPFEYEGEGYAEPDADDEINRLESEIAELEGSAPPTDDYFRQVSRLGPLNGQVITSADHSQASRLGSLNGPVISLEKRIYYHDEPIVIRYSIPRSYVAEGWEEVNLYFTANHRGLGVVIVDDGRPNSYRLDSQEGTKEVWFSLDAGLAFNDVNIGVIRWTGPRTFGPHHETVSTKLIRIVRREPLLPGAIRIAGGAIHPLGQPVFVDVQIPADRFAGANEKPNRYGKRNFKLKLVRKGNRVRGNATTLDRVMAQVPVTEMVQRFDMTNVQPWGSTFNLKPDNVLFYPGEYEIQLVTDKFIVDRKRLTITVDELPNVLRLVSTEPSEPLKRDEYNIYLDVVFDAPKLAPGLQYALQEVRVYDDGHLNNRGRWYYWEPGKPKRLDWRPGGNWAVQLMLISNKSYDKRYYILDQLNFHVGGDFNRMDSSNTRSVYINNQPAQGAVVPSGVEIPVKIHIQEHYFGTGSSVTARLYAKPADAPKKPNEFGLRPRTPFKEWGKPIHEWPILKGGYSSYNIEQHLPIGHYGIMISYKDWDNTRISINQSKFRVTGNPKDAQIDLGEERTFSYDQPIPITLELPEGFSPDDPRLSLWIEYVGGYVPGCAIEVISGYTETGDMLMKVDLKGQTSVTVKPIARPGLYIARLDYAIGDKDYVTRDKFADHLPMAGTAFEVVIAPLSNALSLSGGSTESMKVIVDPPANHSLRTPWDGEQKHSPLLSYFRLGVTAVGGAVTDPVEIGSYTSSYLSLEDGGRAEMEVYTEGLSGFYEARLHDLLTSTHCNWSGVGCPVLASVPYQFAANPKSPFPPGYGGLGPTGIRSEIPIAGTIWPPIGEYLTGADCKPRIVEVEKIPCCVLKDNLITWPVTTDPLEPPEIQEAMQEPAVGAHNVFLHDGSFFESVEDMMVPALGTDFHMARTYRSNVKTKAGGLIGHKWDFAFNKRIVPMPPRVNDQGLALEVKGEDTPQLNYYNGLGRRDLFTEKHSGPRRVFNWDTHFKAYVTTYDSPPGMFFEIQRYVILEGVHPFIEHDNVKGYEKIFYVLRLKNGHQYIFNCRGQIIYIIDRHGLRMTFLYQGPLNPLTQNKMLSEIEDASGRVYSFGFINIGEGMLNTNIDCKKEKRNIDIPRFKTVTDFDGRKIVYNYKDGNTKPVLESVTLEFKTGSRTFKYEYDGEYKLKSITDPQNEGKPYIINTYVEGQVRKQKYGTDRMKIEYETPIKVTDARSTVKEYLLGYLEDVAVVKQLTLRGGGNGRASGPWTVEFQYNDDSQITEIKSASGKRTTMKYASNSGRPVKLGKVRNWKDKEWTYENDLARGNLLEVALHSADPDDEYKEIKTSYEYEPLYNRLRKETDPRGAVTMYEYDYDLPHSGYNGEPKIVHLPDLTLATGSRLTGLKIENRYYMTGQVKSTKNTSGYITVYNIYNRFGYRTKVYRPNSGYDSYERDVRGNVKKHTDNKGVVTTFEIDGFDQVTQRVDDVNGFKNVSTFEYDLNGNKIKATIDLKDNFMAEDVGVPERASPGKLITSWTYDILNRPLVVKSSGGGTSNKFINKYDKAGNKILVTKPSPADNGITVMKKIDYDARGLVRRITEAMLKDEERVWEIAYNADGNVEREIDPRGFKTQYYYDGFGRKRTAHLPSKAVIEYVLDKNNNIESVETIGMTGTPGQPQARLKLTENVFDEMNHLISKKEYTVVNGDVLETKYVYNRALMVEKVIAPGNATTAYVYTNGLVKEITDPEGNKEIYGYDEVGNRNSVIVWKKMPSEDSYMSLPVLPLLSNIYHPPIESLLNPEAVEYSFRYDSLGRIYAQTGPTGTTRHFYNSQGMPRGTTDENRNLTEIRYDSLGRKALVRHGGQTTKYNYYPSGQLREVESLPLKHEKWIYDAMGRMKTHENVLTGASTTVNKYDKAGNPLIKTDPNGTKVTTTYNALGLPDTVNVTYGKVNVTYDPANPETVNVTYGPVRENTGSDNREVAAGVSIESNRYDSLGRLVHTSNNQDITVELAYDGLDRVVSDSQTIEGNTQVVRTDYQGDLSKETITYPKVAGNVKITRGKDRLGRVTFVRDPSGPVALYKYAGKDHVQSIFYGNRIKSFFTIDRMTRLRNISTVFLYDPEAPAFVNEHVLHEKIGGLTAKGIWSGQVDYPDFLTTRIYESFDSVKDQDPTKTLIITIDRTNREISTTTERWGYREAEPKSVSSILREYDGHGRVKTIAESLSQEASDSDNPILALARTDAFTYKETKVDSVTTRVVQDVKAERFFSMGMQWMKDKVKGTKFADTQEFHYDKNGNLVADDRFVYTYDYKNRLFVVYDRRFPYRFHQSVAFRYDNLGRRVEMTHQKDREPKYLLNVKWPSPFRENDVRFLYHGSKCIAESGKNNKMLARYYYGARPYELIRMDRHEDENPKNKLQTYYLHAGVQGQVKVLTDEKGRAFKTFSPGAPAGKRLGISWAFPDDKIFISGTKTKNPYISSTLRIDSFAGIQYRADTQSTILDYRSAHKTFHDLDVEAFRSSITRSMNQAGVAAVAGMALPVAILHAPLLALKSGAAGLGFYAGSSVVTGAELTVEGAAISIGLSILGGSVGGAIANTSLSLTQQLAANYAADLAAGMFVDMAWNDAGFTDALSNNMISASINAGIGFIGARIMFKKGARTEFKKSVVFADPMDARTRGVPRREIFIPEHRLLAAKHRKIYDALCRHKLVPVVLDSNTVKLAGDLMQLTGKEILIGYSPRFKGSFVLKLGSYTNVSSKGILHVMAHSHPSGSLRPSPKDLLGFSKGKEGSHGIFDVAGNIKFFPIAGKQPGIIPPRLLDPKRLAVQEREIRELWGYTP